MESFDPYEVEAELGRGGMGAVYRARHRELGRRVALKVLTFASDAHRRRFLREADALGRLAHPNILKVHSVGVSTVTPGVERRPFLVLELIEGESLDDRLERGDPLPWREAAVLAAKLARALEHAHALGLLHRDVKPGNVLLAAGGEPKLSDFGLAKDLAGDGSLLTQNGQMLGSPGYAAPEQLAVVAGEHGPATDVYGLGATLYAALTGVPPFTGTLMEVVTSTISRAPAPPSRLRPEVPRGLEAVCLRCLEKDPARRYPSAGALADDLERVVRDEAPLRAAPPSRPLLARVGRLARRAVVLSGALVAVALTLVGLAVLEGRRARLAREGAQALVERADDLRRRGDAARALDAYTSALALDPASSTALEGRGALRLALGDLVGARADLSACLGPTPRPSALLLRARARSRSGDAAGAAADVARVLELDPLHVEALLLRGASRLTADPAGAEADLGVVITLDPARVAAWEGRASARLSLGDLPGALDDLSRALERSPDDADLWLRSALARERAEQPLAAEDDATRGLACAGAESAPLLRLRGRLRLARDDRAGAIADLAAAIDRAPDAATYHLLGRARARDDPTGAAADLSRALELDPTLVDAWHARGLVRLALDDAEGAAQDLARAAELDPELLAPHVELAQLHARARDSAAAAAAATRALELDPANVGMLRVRGRARHALGASAEAIADHERALAIEPGDRGAWNDLAEDRLALGDLPGAIAAADRAIELEPDATRAYRLRGLARARQGDRGGLDDLRRVAASGGHKATAHHALAEGYELLGDHEGLEGALTEALAVEPSPVVRLSLHKRRASARLLRGDLLGALEEVDAVLSLGFGYVSLTGWHEEWLARWDRVVLEHPDRPEGWVGRATVRLKLGDKEGARSDAKRAVQLDPEGPWSLRARGTVRTALGQATRALPDLERAVAQAPLAGMGWYQLARARNQAGHHRLALEAYGRAIELDPTNGMFWAGRANARLHRGDAAGALIDCSRTIELAPFYTGGWADRAQARLLLGEVRGAAEDAIRATELSSGHGPSWALRGLARATLGEPDAAADLARALELLPGDHRFVPDCQQALQRLRR